MHEDVYDAVLGELVAYTQTVKVGDGSTADTQLGPIQNEPQYRKVIEYFEDCERNGHRFALGGKIDRNAQGLVRPGDARRQPARGFAARRRGAVRPDPADAQVARRGRRRYAARTTRATASVPPSGAATSHAVQRIGSQLEAGTVWLNEVHQYSPHQAFGGHKESGIGCENSLHGLMEYTNWQTITLRKNAGFGRQTTTRAA